MDDYQYFEELSLRPFSLRSLQLFEAASQIIRTRFPNGSRVSESCGTVLGPFREAVEKCSDKWSSNLRVGDQWIDYARRLAQTEPPNGDGRLTLPIWTLSHGFQYLDDEVVEAYLGLLGTSSQSIDIVEIRRKHPGLRTYSIWEGIERPAVIPFQDGTDWAFAVAYPDCVHWYDSRPDKPRPHLSAGGSRDVVEGWSGPKQSRLADSGVFMLIGIRCILEGIPHLSQTLANELAETFRSRMLVELLAGKINPSDADFRRLPSLDSPREHRFFDDAVFGTQLDHGSGYEGIVGLTPPRSTQARELSSEPCSTLPSVSSSVARPELVPSSPRPEPSDRTSPTSSSISTSPSLVSNCDEDPRRLILDNLSKAVQIKRSVSANIDLDRAVLWSLVQKDGFRSPLHQKYLAVLFHDKVVQLRGAGRRRSRFRFWKDVSRLGERSGLGSLVILCAVSVLPHRAMSRADQNKTISELERRLRTSTDPLLGLLQQARDLCEQTLLDSLPDERLMIENYHRGFTLEEQMYDALVSLNPRVRLLLPSISAQADLLD